MTFTPTDFILLSGVSETPGVRLTWTGQANDSRAVEFTDVGNDGILTLGADSVSMGGATYSGWYITVDGRNYGIFQTTNDNFAIIPYDRGIDNLAHGIAPLAPIPDGITTSYDPALIQTANCFLAGTRIETPSGPVPIERLAIGDLVTTADGRNVPVRWLWRQQLTNVFGTGERRAPVRVSADALGPGRPSRDLTVTADHGLILEGLLINAGALVNDRSIRLIPMSDMPARFTYWHVETAKHDTILAEGCPAETYIDYTARHSFDNHAAYLRHYGTEPVIAEMALPRISSARMLPSALKARLGIANAA